MYYLIRFSGVRISLLRSSALADRSAAIAGHSDGGLRHANGRGDVAVDGFYLIRLPKVTASKPPIRFRLAEYPATPVPGAEALARPRLQRSAAEEILVLRLPRRTAAPIGAPPPRAPAAIAVAPGAMSCLWHNPTRLATASWARFHVSGS